MPEYGFRSCPVCGSKAATERYLLEQVLFDEHPLEGRHSASTCVECGMAFNRVAYGGGRLDEYYKSQDRYLLLDNNLSIDPYYREIAKLLESLLPSSDLSLIDIGCGGGQLLRALKNTRLKNIHGADLSARCVDFVRSYLHLPCVHGDVDQACAIFKTCDVAVATGVFEHIENPRAACHSLSNLVCEGGFAFILVPDVMRYVSSLSAPFQDFNVEHINHFSFTSLKCMFEMEGWREISRGTIDRRVSATCCYPDMWILFQNAKSTARFLRDFSSGEAIDNYVTCSNKLLDDILLHLERELVDVKTYVMWGVGQTASVLLGRGRCKNSRPSLYIDLNRSYRGQRIDGVPIVDDETAIKVMEELLLSDAPIVVASMRDVDSIQSSINRTLGGSRTVISLLPHSQ